jgi:mannonate dehydratase
MRKPTRRELLKRAGAAALALPATRRLPALSAQSRRVPDEGPGTPRICLEPGAAGPLPEGLSGDETTAARARRIRQLGVTHLLAGGPPIPWDEPTIRARMDEWQRHGVTVANLMISGFPNAIYNRPGRDADIEKVIRSIRAAGRGRKWARSTAGIGTSPS